VMPKPMTFKHWINLTDSSTHELGNVVN